MNAKFALVSVMLVSSKVVTVALALSGGVLAPTLTTTVLLAVPLFPSEIEYVMVAGPVKFRAGIKRNVPSLLMVTLPCTAGTVALATLSVSPSTSVSLPSTLMLATVVLMGVVALSLTATGLSFTGVTVMLTVAVDVPPLPSVMVYVKLAGPL